MKGSYFVHVPNDKVNQDLESSQQAAQQAEAFIEDELEQFA